MPACPRKVSGERATPRRAAQGTAVCCPRFAISGRDTARFGAFAAPPPALQWPPPRFRNTAMPRTTPDIDPNAELHGFEPLRIALALGALLLGFLAAL